VPNNTILMEKNTFEQYPELAKHMERMASTGSTGNMNEWNQFCAQLNLVLTDKGDTPFWFTNFNRPRYSKDDETFSETVLMSDDEGFYTTGWFDFKRNEWQYDGDFEMPSKFYWRYFPKVRKPPIAFEAKTA
jgi:hypothetical protein